VKFSVTVNLNQCDEFRGEYMNQKTSPRSIRGPLFGAGAAGLILVGLMLSQFLPGTGLGTTENVNPDSIQVSTESSPANFPAPGKTTDPEAAKPATMERLPVSAPTICEVLIDEKKYFIKQDQSWVPMELEKIVEFASLASGDNTGIKVKIFRKPTSMTSAEENLQRALKDKGLKETAVYLVPDLLKE
jgi:hypothetical protein